jgi:hypothetical protein
MGGKTGHAAAWAFSNCSTIGAKKAYPALVSFHPPILLICRFVAFDLPLERKKNEF